MICARLAVSAPNRATERARYFEAHRAFLRSLPLEIIRSGPLFGQDGAQWGALVVAEAPDLAAMEAACAPDPFVQHGVYGDVTFLEWRVTLGER